MRRLALGLLAFLVLPLAGCSNPCQDLGDLICTCSASGTSGDTCKQQVKNQLNDTGVSSSASAFCSQKLDTCKAPAQPADVKFCEWINTGCGKASCGLSSEDPTDPLVCVPPTP
jgi:putative hemolysin